MHQATVHAACDPARLMNLEYNVKHRCPDRLPLLNLYKVDSITHVYLKTALKIG